MAVVAAGELEDLGRGGRAPGESDRRHRGLVPEETSRIISTEWHASTISAASFNLPLGGGPEARAASAARRTASTVSTGVSEDQCSPRLHPVHIAAVVDVLEVRALAAPDEERLVEADRAHRAHRRVDAAGITRWALGPELGAGAYSQRAASFAQ